MVLIGWSYNSQENESYVDFLRSLRYEPVMKPILRRLFCAVESAVKAKLAACHHCTLVVDSWKNHPGALCRCTER